MPAPVVFDQCWMHHVGKGQLHFSSIDTANASVPLYVPIPPGQGVFVSELADE